jgi:para-aminobenzoate synthetase / 4-amino-4-deoxychorismate lyase
MAAGQTLFAGQSETERVCLHDAQTRQWLAFSRPYRVIATGKTDEVMDCLHVVEWLVAHHGWAAAGFLAYEATPPFDPALSV